MNSGDNQKLTVGILQCGEVPENLRDAFVDYNDMIAQMLTHSDSALVCRTWRVFDGEIPEPDDCDAWITTGSRDSVNDESDWTHALCDFVARVAKTDIPFVGICYGMQMMARALGGKVEISTRGWGIGVAQSVVLRPMPWMDGATPTVHLVVSHQEQVTALPEGTELIAGNDFCPNSIITAAGNMLGIQGHPEFTTEYSRALMEMRLSIIPAERIAQGIDSLSIEVDGARVFDWITSFIRLGTLASPVV